MVADDYADSLLYVVRSDDGSFVRSLGRRGKGPGEVESVWAMQPVAGSDRLLWVYDLSLYRLVQVDLEAPPEQRPRARTVVLRSPAMLYNVMWAGDARLVGTGFFAEPGRFALLRPTGELDRLAGELPEGGPPAPLPVRNHAFQSSMAYEPTRDLLVLATRHADIIEIYRPEGEMVNRSRGPAGGFDPVFTVAQRAGQPTFAQGDDLRFGYLDVAADREHIYALYSGRRQGEAPAEAGYGREVHLYGWDGKLSRVLPLDTPVLAIAVGGSPGRLFGIRGEPTPAIVAFSLPKP